MLLSSVINLAVEPEVCEAIFWNIKSWTAIWAPMEKVNLLYEDNLYQEVEMQVDRDGVLETNRTFRMRHPDKLTIDFFSAVPPPMMSIHNGVWDFRKTDKGTKISATREFALSRNTAESDKNYVERMEKFAAQFKSRLDKILQSFKEKIESGDNCHV